MADATGGAAANGTSNGYPTSYAAKFNLASHFIGGNEISRAAPSKVKDFVAANDGHTVITNVSTAKHGSREARAAVSRQAAGADWIF